MLLPKSRSAVSHSKAMSKQVNQASKALFKLSCQCNRLDLPIDVQLELYKVLVLPILLYGSEVWGFENLYQLESFQLKFLKRLLKVHKRTSNCMVYGETGMFKLMKLVECKMLTFWARIISGKESKISCLLYKLQKVLYVNGTYEAPWLKKIKEIMDKSGMSYLWYTEGPVNVQYIKAAIDRKLSDIYEQEWVAEVNQNGHCKTYKLFKQRLVLEKYLTELQPNLRIHLTKFRCCNNKLPVVTGRYLNIEYNNRLCTLCNQGFLGDESHYIFECTSLSRERVLFINRNLRYGPNTLNLYKIFNANYSDLCRLAKFCNIIMKKHL